MNPRPRAIFLRPSLGLGGAERWAIDAAKALQADGWDVEIAVNQFDPRRTFPEARSGEIKVSALGGRPAALATARFRAVSALAGQWILLRRLRRRERGADPDLLIFDLVPHAADWARARFPRSAVLIYCHFPDVAPGPPRGFYGLYRAAIARRETRGMLAAHRVLANSRFTAAAIRRAFPRLPADRLAIVSPGVALGSAPAPRDPPPLFSILVLARFDPFKNHSLALAAYEALQLGLPAEQFARTRLIFAGGYDRGLPEARAWVESLQARSTAAGLAPQVEFHFDPAPSELAAMWERISALLHPARAEHFGIVLIEAMARGLPVLAVDHGGPAEIVADGLTGALRPADPEAFAEVLRRWVEQPELAAAAGRAGRIRALERFSAERFAQAFADQARSSLLSAEVRNA